MFCSSCRHAGRGRAMRRGFTLVELLVVVSIIALLIGILLPALGKATGQAKGVRCLSQMRQIDMAARMYMDASEGVAIPLWINEKAPGWSAWDYDAAGFVVQVDTMLWWPDKLRLDGYVDSVDVFNCPALSEPAQRASGGSLSAENSLGIGMNYPEYGTLAVAPGFPLPVYGKARASQVARPSQFAILADAAEISNPTDPNADAWLEVPATGCVFFRVPSDYYSYPDGDARSVPRHGSRVSTAFFDGHAEAIANNAFRYDLPRTHSGILWAKNSRGTSP